MDELPQSRQKTGELITRRRKALGLTQKELAAQLLVSDKTVSKWEAGGGYPEVTLLAPLAAALGLSADELLAGRQNEAATPAPPAPAAQNARLWLLQSARQKYVLVTLVGLLLFGAWVTLAAAGYHTLYPVGMLAAVLAAVFLLFASAAWYSLRSRAMDYSPRGELRYVGGGTAALAGMALFAVWCSQYTGWSRFQIPNGSGYLKGEELLTQLNYLGGNRIYGFGLYVLALGLAVSAFILLRGCEKRPPLCFALALPVIGCGTILVQLWLAGRLRDRFPLTLTSKGLPPSPLPAYWKESAYALAALLVMLGLLCLLFRKGVVYKLALACALLYGATDLGQGIFLALNVTVQKYGVRYYSWFGVYAPYCLLIGLAWGLAAYHACAVWAASPKKE